MQALVPRPRRWQWICLARASPTARVTWRPCGDSRANGELHRALASTRATRVRSGAHTAADVTAWRDSVVHQLASARAVLPPDERSRRSDALRAALAHLWTQRSATRRFHLGRPLLPPAGDWMTSTSKASRCAARGAPAQARRAPRRRRPAPLDRYRAASTRAPRSRCATGQGTRRARSSRVPFRAGPPVPPRFDTASATSSPFELEKAAYEIVYEANHADCSIPRAASHPSPASAERGLSELTRKGMPGRGWGGVKVMVATPWRLAK